MNRHSFIATAALVGILGSGMVEALTFTATLDPIRVAAEPGTRQTRSFHLNLPAGEPATRFRSRVEDFWRNEDGSRSFYRPAGTIPTSCGPWVSLDPVEAEVEPGGRLDLRLSIDTPEATPPGGYWCALTLDQLPGLPDESLPDTPRLEFLASVSVAIYVTVEPVHRAARIGSVEIDGEGCDVLLVNEGDTPLSAEGRVEFLGEDGAVVASVTLPRNLVLPEPFPRTRVRAPLPPEEQLPSGRYRVQILVDIGLDHYIGARSEVEVSRGTPAASAIG